jgi:hypothetical protein
MEHPKIIQSFKSWSFLIRKPMILEYPNFGKHLFDPELELQQLVSTTIK